MKRVAPVVLLFLLLGAAPRAARAADEGVQWIGTLDHAFEVAKARGALIFIVEIMDNEPANDAQKEEYRNPVFVKASRNFVCVYANPMRQHGTVEVTVDGKKVHRCKDAPTITCDEHLTAYNQVQARYAKLNTASDGGVKMPFQFIIDANGKELVSVVNGSVETGFDPIPGAAMAEIMNKIIQQIGKPLTPEQYTELKGKLEEAEKASKDEDYRKAMKLCVEIVKANDKTTLADRAKALEKGIIDKGKAKLETILAEKGGDPLDKVSKLEELAGDYAGSDFEKEVKAKLSELKKDPKVKSALGDLAARREAEDQIQRAEALVKKEEYAKALSILDGVAEKFAGKAVGKKAKARAAELRSDETIAQAALQQEAAKYCKGWLSLGKSYAQNGMTAKAKELFQKVIEKYPGTTFAEEAQRELEKLK